MKKLLLALFIFMVSRVVFGQVEPESTSVENYQKGVFYAAQGDFESANKQFSLCLGKNKDDESCLKGIAKIEEVDKGNLEKAYVIIIFKGLQSLYDGNNEEVIMYHQQALKMRPDLPESYGDLCAVYLMCNNPSAAVPYCHQAVKMDPNYRDAYSNLGSAYSELKDPKKAIEYYRRSLDIDNQNPAAYLGIGAAYYQDWNDEESKKALLESKRLYNERGFYQRAKDVEGYLKEMFPDEIDP